MRKRQQNDAKKNYLGLARTMVPLTEITKKKNWSWFWPDCIWCVTVHPGMKAIHHTIGNSGDPGARNKNCKEF